MKLRAHPFAAAVSGLAGLALAAGPMIPAVAAAVQDAASTPGVVTFLGAFSGGLVAGLAGPRRIVAGAVGAHATGCPALAAWRANAPKG